MSAETFTVFRTRMGAPTGWSADAFLSDLGEALLMEGGVQKHEWTAASPTTIQKSWLWPPHLFLNAQCKKHETPS